MIKSESDSFAKFRVRFGLGIEMICGIIYELRPIDIEQGSRNKGWEEVKIEGNINSLGARILLRHRARGG